MALNLNKPQDNSAQTQEKPASRPDTLTLELALYKNYTKGKTTYTTGTRYIFARQTAMQLLQEEDMGRPLWKIYRKPPERLRKPSVIDATEVEVQEEGEPIHGVDTSKNRIDIGDDSEIQDLLPGNETGDDGNLEV